MAFSLGIVGAGQFSGQFATLFHHHPGVSEVWVTDSIPERARQLVSTAGLAGTMADFDEMLRSPVDAIAIFTQRWTHGPLVVRALRAGKHVYSAVPMAITVDEIAAIVDAVRETGLTYMMGETSYYNPATVYARQKLASGEFGRLFYAEGDYVHDMDLGFYDAYRYSAAARTGSRLRATPHCFIRRTPSAGCSEPGRPTRQRVGCIGVRGRSPRRRLRSVGEPVRQRLLQRHSPLRARCGGSMRINEFRRVGYPVAIDASRDSAGSAPTARSSSSRPRRTGRPARASTRSPTSSTRSPTLDADDPSLRARRTRAPRRVRLGMRRDPRPRAPPRGTPGPAQRARGQPPLPRRRLRACGGRRHAATRECVDGGTLHPPRRDRPRVGAARRRTARGPRPGRRRGIRPSPAQRGGQSLALQSRRTPEAATRAAAERGKLR